MCTTRAQLAWQVNRAFSRHSQYSLFDKSLSLWSHSELNWNCCRMHRWIDRLVEHGDWLDGTAQPQSECY